MWWSVKLSLWNLGPDHRGVVGHRVRVDGDQEWPQDQADVRNTMKLSKLITVIRCHQVKHKFGTRAVHFCIKSHKRLRTNTKKDLKVNFIIWMKFKNAFIPERMIFNWFIDYWFIKIDNADNIYWFWWKIFTPNVSWSIFVTGREIIYEMLKITC